MVNTPLWLKPDLVVNNSPNILDACPDIEILHTEHQHRSISARYMVKGYRIRLAKITFNPLFTNAFFKVRQYQMQRPSCLPYEDIKLTVSKFFKKKIWIRLV